jgi:hypothetical protein
MLGTYIAIIEGKVHQSIDKTNWTYVTNSSFETNGQSWVIHYDDVTIQYERGLYTITNGITKSFSYNGTLWVD